MKRVTSEQKQTVVNMYVHGHRRVDIAEAVGISVGSVQSILKKYTYLHSNVIGYARMYNAKLNERRHYYSDYYYDTREEARKRDAVASILAIIAQ